MRSTKTLDYVVDCVRTVSLLDPGGMISFKQLPSSATPIIREASINVIECHARFSDDRLSNVA